MGTTGTALTWVDEKISEKRYSNGGHSVYEISRNDLLLLLITLHMYFTISETGTGF